MKRAARTLAAALTAALLLPLAGCVNDETTAPATGSEAYSPVTTAAETVDLYGNVPGGDYGGMTFSVLNQNISWALCPLGSEGINGEVLNDTVYERNTALEEKLNIKLAVTDEKDGTAHNTAKNLILANDSMYDLNCLGAYRVAPMLSQRLFADLTKQSDLHLAEPWYNQLTQPEYTLQGQLYMVHGVAQIEYFEGLWVLYFNKKLIADNKLEDPYELVHSGKWTIDRFTAMMKTGMKDLDADGLIGGDDVYGFSTHSGVTLSFLHGCDERAIVPDATGTPSVVTPDNRMISVIEAIQTIMTDKGIRSVSDTTKNALFMADQALFLGETLGSASKLREMESDFGIIPSPKYD